MDATTKIDGQTLTVPAGTTVLAAAERLGITIPTLCHHPALEAYGACRVCLVEAKQGEWSKLVTACNYPVRDGLEIETDNERVRAQRKLVFEFLLSMAPGSEKLRDLAARYGVTSSRFAPRSRESDCILCGLCVRVCGELLGNEAIAFANRGGKRDVSPPFAARAEDCVACGACASVCPLEIIGISDNDAERRIDRWHATATLQTCTACGARYAPEPLLAKVAAQVEVSEEILQLCRACRRKKYIGDLSAGNE